MTAHDGLFLADKARGITSHDAVELFRRRSRIKKVGHAGTLDPLATGLLILCVGRATRLQSLMMKMEKTYEGTIQFGWATDTYDSAGVPVGDATPQSVESFDFAPILETFQGEIEQVPPAFSAKKVQGVRSYELARKGQAVPLEPRRVTIYEIDFRLESPSLASFRVRCSAGTYVRSIAHEIGIAAGVGAHLASLKRTAIGPYRVEASMPTDTLRETETQRLFDPPSFVPVDQIDLPLPDVLIDRVQEGKMARGHSVIVKLDAEELEPGQLVRVNNTAGAFVAIGEITERLRDGGPVVLRPKVVVRG